MGRTQRTRKRNAIKAKRPVFGKTGYKRQKKQSNMSLTRVVFRPKNNMYSPLPMRYLTKFTASSAAYTTTGGGTGVYNSYFKLNSPIHPFAGITTGFTFITGAAAATLNPAGLTTLLAPNMYTGCVVSGVLIEIDASPQSVVDSVIITLTPSEVNNLPASMGSALDKPWTKQQNFASGRVNRLGDYPMKQYYSVSKFFGIPKYLYDNDLSGNFVATVSAGGVYSDPPGISYVVMNIQTGDNSSLANPLEIRFRVTYYCELKTLYTYSMTIT